MLWHPIVAAIHVPAALLLIQLLAYCLWPRKAAENGSNPWASLPCGRPGNCSLLPALFRPHSGHCNHLGCDQLHKRFIHFLSLFHALLSVNLLLSVNKSLNKNKHPPPNSGYKDDHWDCEGSSEIAPGERLTARGGKFTGQKDSVRQKNQKSSSSQKPKKTNQKFQLMHVRH